MVNEDYRFRFGTLTKSGPAYRLLYNKEPAKHHAQTVKGLLSIHAINAPASAEH